MYRSPIRLIGFTGWHQEHVSLKSALLLARRKMEAEFELADSSTVAFGGQELNRQEVVSLFDELKDEQRLAWHLAIYEDQALLHFLEGGVLEPGERWASNEVYADPGFIRFVSPFFAEAINAFYRRLLAGETSLKALHALATNDSFMLSADSERAFRYTTRYFLEKKNELMRLQQRAQSSEAILRQEVKDSVTDEALQVLNHLPDSYNDLRYQVANALNNLCVAFDQKNYKRHALVAIEKAAQVAVADEELQTLIPRNLTIIRSKQTGSLFKVDAQGRKQPKWGWIVGILILLFRIASCVASTGDTSTYSGPEDLYQVPASSQLALQPQPLQTFNSLVFSLTGSEPDSFRFRMTQDSYMAYEPEKTGELVFPALLRIEFGSSDIRTDSVAGLPQKTLLVRNRSSWHLLLCYTMDDKAFFIRHVAPRDEYRLLYKAGMMQATIVAGKDWDLHRHFIYNSYAGGTLTEIHGIAGGYARIPDNMRQLVAEETGPLYTNADTAVLSETLDVADSAANSISVRKQPGAVHL